MRNHYLNRNYLIIICLFMLIMAACNTPEEGCLDIRASNFDFDGDKECDDCCTYPKLVLSVSHQWGTEKPYRKDSVYISSLGDTFKVKDVRYFISNVVLQDADNVPYEVEETLDISCLENGVSIDKEIVEDISIVNISSPYSTIGSFKQDGPIISGSIKLGLSEDVLCVESDELATGDLSDESRLYRKSTQNLHILRWIIERDTSTAVLDTIWVDHPALEFNFNVNKEFRTGFNDSLFFNMRYDSWLDGINLKTMSNAEIASGIKHNLANSFQFVK